MSLIVVEFAPLVPMRGLDGGIDLGAQIGPVLGGGHWPLLDGGINRS